MPRITGSGAPLTDLAAPTRAGRPTAAEEIPAAASVPSTAAFAALLAGALAPALDAGRAAGPPGEDEAPVDAGDDAGDQPAADAEPDATGAAAPDALAPALLALAAPAASTTPPTTGPHSTAEAGDLALEEMAAGTTSSRPAARPVTRPTRDLGLVAPALRERVGRVIRRMRDEFGHAVEVVESARTQARQDHLFAQGRTRPGPVVTWTRHSEHTRGRAVDVTIDGGYEDAAAFRLLQRVAREEGLATLGMRDPGHLQLPADVPGGAPEAFARFADGGGEAEAGGAWLAGVRVESVGVEVEQAADSLPRPVAPVANPAGVAAVAPVAPVAAVAAVATVAQVAAVAVPGAPAASAPRATAAPAAPRRAHAPNRPAGPTGERPDRAAEAAPGPSPGGGALGDATRAAIGAATSGGQDASDANDHHAAAAPRVAARRRQATAAPDAPAANPAPDAAAARPAAAPGTPLGAPPPAAPDASSGATLGAVAAQRVADVLAAQERGGARQLSHLTLRLDNAAGGEDRVRVDLRAGAGGPAAVGARIDVADLGDAGRLAARAGELRDALARHGLSADLVQVGGVARARDAGGAAASTPAAPSATSSVADAGAAGAAGSAGGSLGGNPGGSASSSSQQSPGRGASDGRDRQAGGDAPPHAFGRDGRGNGGGDPRHQGRRPRDGWLYDELAAPRRTR